MFNPWDWGDDRVIMKITVELVDLFVKLNPDTYEGYVVYGIRKWKKGYLCGSTASNIWNAGSFVVILQESR